ncbi:FtsX-like permease family protein [Brassicibacter mesophilus]|uniref:FtsX-like permease family protein n=1 Tax=Brassicibacter mesophilus TaxID=745119 RepID=UPI003D21C822
MFKYILKTLKYYKIQTISLLIALIAIQSGICTGILSLYQTQVNVSEDIENYSRDIYDILVRPENSESLTKQIEKNRLIEPNYLSKGEGGISIEDWKEIQSIQGIEVAAPAASMGFFNNSKNSVQLELPLDFAIRADISYKTTDGCHKYDIIPEGGNSDSTAICINNVDKLDRPYVSLKSSDTSLRGSENGIFLQWLLPPIYNFLVAVDMESERRLTGLDIGDVEYIFSEPLEERSKIGDYDAYDIPVLVNDEVKIPIEVNIKIEELGKIRDEVEELLIKDKKIPRNSTREEAKEKAMLRREIDNKIKNIKGINEKNIRLDLSKYLNAFQTTGIVYQYLNGDIKLTNEGLIRFFPAIEYYTTEGIEYGTEKSNDDIVMIPKPVGIKDEQIQYNQLKEKGKDRTISIEEYVKKGNKIYNLVPVANTSFSGPKRNELVKAPLGVYGSEKFYIEDDEKGSQLEGKRELYPTTTLGTFLLPAAHGFTTLEAAELIKGDKPIDAIRVRVAGVDSYNRDGKAKIERVAEEIVLKTGLHVDIVAGSSPREIKLKLQDYKGIKGIGQVVTSWINLNVSTMVQKEFNLLVITISAFFIIISLIFLYNRTQVYIWHRRKEIKVLKGEGWTKRRISIMLSSETIIVWLLSMIGTGFIGIFIKRILSVSWLLFFECFISIIIIGGVVLYISAYNSTYRSYEKIFRKEKNRNVKSRNTSNSAKFLFWADMHYYRDRLMLMIIQILIGGALCFFSWFAISAVESHVTTTVFGAFIHARVGSWLKLIGISTFLLVLLTFFDSILSYFDLRKKDIQLLKQLGWQKAYINKLMYPQIVIPTAIASISAIAVGTIFTKMIYEKFSVPIALAITADMILPIISLLMTYTWIDDIYRTGKEMAKAKKLRHQIALASVFILIAGIFVSTRIGNRFKTVTNEGSIEDNNAHENGNIALKMIDEIVGLGNRPVGSEANQKEIEILCEFLEDSGLEVQKKEVKVPPYRRLKEGSKLKINNHVVDFLSIIVDLSSTVEGKKYEIEDRNPIIINLENVDKEDIKGHIVMIDKHLSINDLKEIIRKSKDKGAQAIIQTDINGTNQKIEDVKLEFEVVELYQGYSSENIWVDIAGRNEGTPFLVTTNHGSVGPGAVNNASGVAALAVLAKEFKTNTPTHPIRFLWAAGGEENVDGGIARYLEPNPKHSGALVLKSIGTKDRLFIGFRRDNLYGSSGRVQNIAKDVEEKDLISYVKEIGIHHSQVFDLDHPINVEYIKHDGDIEKLITPDKWMEITQEISHEIKMFFQPGVMTSTGGLIGKTGIPEVDFFRPSPYRNTYKDTIDKIELKILGKDIHFAEKIIRKITEE